MGRPKKYASAAERQRAYKKRVSSAVSSPNKESIVSSFVTKDSFVTSDETARLHELIMALADRVADQSELLSKVAERSPDVRQTFSRRAPDAFDEFWEAFPATRKMDKAKCRKAFSMKTNKVPPERIIAAAQEYAASPVGRGKYAKAPLTWLNGEGWDDDRSAWQRSENGHTDLYSELRNFVGGDL